MTPKWLPFYGILDGNQFWIFCVGGKKSKKLKAFERVYSVKNFYSFIFIFVNFDSVNTKGSKHTIGISIIDICLVVFCANHRIAPITLYHMMALWGGRPI